MIARLRTRVKFCGMTSAGDVALAVAAGADAVGVILAPSARRVTLERVAEIAAAIPPFVSRIGVVVDPSEEEAGVLGDLGFTLQFCGDETPETCAALAAGAPYVKVFHVPADATAFDFSPCAAYTHATWMFDTRAPRHGGGSGMTFSWQLIEAAARERPIIVSGGLSAANVGACVAALGPYAVDVRSGIESDGRKDAAKMSAFLAAVRGADEARGGYAC